jgi:hypothetical protein
MKGNSNLNPNLITRLRENTVLDGLHYLELSNSQAGPREVKSIADAIKYNIQSIEVGLAPLISIDLSGNQICID